MMVSFDFLSDPIELSPGKASSLYIENQKLYRNTIINLYAECPKNCGVVFSEKYEPLNFKGNICFVSDFCRLDFSSSIIKKLYEDFTMYACDFMLEQTTALKAEVLKFLEKLNEGFDFDFSFKEELELADLFKIQCLKPKLGNEDIPENILDFVKFMKKYTSFKCFIFLNLHSFLTPDELEIFLNEIAYLNVCVLMLENKKCFNNSSKEVVYIIDEDLCEIVEK